MAQLKESEMISRLSSGEAPYTITLDKYKRLLAYTNSISFYIWAYLGIGSGPAIFARTCPYCSKHNGQCKTCDLAKVGICGLNDSVWRSVAAARSNIEYGWSGGKAAAIVDFRDAIERFIDELRRMPGDIF